MLITVKFGSLGVQKCQFNVSHAFSLGVDEEIFVAATNSHRMEISDKLDEFKYQFRMIGKEQGQLSDLRKIVVFDNNQMNFLFIDRRNQSFHDTSLGLEKGRKCVGLAKDEWMRCPIFWKGTANFSNQFAMHLISIIAIGSPDFLLVCTCM